MGNGCRGTVSSLLVKTLLVASTIPFHGREFVNPLFTNVLWIEGAIWKGEGIVYLGHSRETQL